MDRPVADLEYPTREANVRIAEAAVASALDAIRLGYLQAAHRLLYKAIDRLEEAKCPVLCSSRHNIGGCRTKAEGTLM